MNNFFIKKLLLCIGIGYAISVNAQNKISGRILDEYNQGADVAIVMLFTQPDSILNKVEKNIEELNRL